MPKICEVCGKSEDHTEETITNDIYGVCEECISDRHVDFPE